MKWITAIIAIVGIVIVMIFAPNHDIDWRGLAITLGALATLIPVIVTAYQKLNAVDVKQQTDIDSIWRGMVSRGFLGARRSGFIAEKEGKSVVIDKVRELFETKRQELKDIRKFLKSFLGREPFDLELAFEIEKRHQAWLIKEICPAIQREAYECVALACVIARENGSKDHKPGSWKQQ